MYMCILLSSFLLEIVVRGSAKHYQLWFPVSYIVDLPLALDGQARGLILPGPCNHDSSASLSADDIIEQLPKYSPASGILGGTGGRTGAYHAHVF